MWLTLLGIVKNPIQNAKTIFFALLIGAIVTYGVVLWVKNNDLVKQAKVDAASLSEYAVANKGLATQLTNERAEIKRVDTIEAKADTETKAVEPVYIERKVYVKEYIKDPNIPKCTLSPQWVFSHNAAATDPYGNSSAESSSKVRQNSSSASSVRSDATSR